MFNYFYGNRLTNVSAKGKVLHNNDVNPMPLVLEIRANTCLCTKSKAFLRFVDQNSNNRYDCWPPTISSSITNDSQRQAIQQVHLLGVKPKQGSSVSLVIHNTATVQYHFPKVAVSVGEPPQNNEISCSKCNGNPLSAVPVIPVQQSAFLDY